MTQEHSKEKTRVVIGGSHGKTTITSMILHVLHYHMTSIHTYNRLSFNPNY